MSLAARGRANDTRFLQTRTLDLDLAKKSTSSSYYYFFRYLGMLKVSGLKVETLPYFLFRKSWGTTEEWGLNRLSKCEGEKESSLLPIETSG